MASFNVRDLLRSEIHRMEEYTPSQPFEVLSRRLGLPPERIVKLDANENPYGPSSKVKEALARYEYYHIYPDSTQARLREAVQSYVGEWTKPTSCSATARMS